MSDSIDVLTAYVQQNLQLRGIRTSNCVASFMPLDIPRGTQVTLSTNFLSINRVITGIAGLPHCPPVSRSSDHKSVCAMLPEQARSRVYTEFA